MPPLCLAEFEIWYNESFLIPEDVQEALRPGGSIRPGMIPINRVLCLVSWLCSSSLVGDEGTREEDEEEEEEGEGLVLCEAEGDCLSGATSIYRLKQDSD
ncbi:hypothetical protein BTVI_00722 [Pitangus sulphuratus]|nr:hypothetical protein BTVI_00722 [Pitangus sulphuratus]